MMRSLWLVLVLQTVFQIVDAQFCFSSSTLNFEFSLFLNVEAVPGATTQAEIDQIEALFLASYNTVSICDQDGAVFVITGVRIIVNPVEFVTSGRRRLEVLKDNKPPNEEDPENPADHRRLQLDVQSENPSSSPSIFESSIASSSSPSETPVFFQFQSVTWLVLVEGECNGCGTETSLFNDVSGRLLQHVEKHLKQSKKDRLRVKSSAVKGGSLKPTTSLRETASDRTLRVYKGNLNAQDNTCDCEPPFELPFLEEFNEQLEVVETVSAAEDVVLLEQVECASEVTDFQSTVVVLANVDLDNFYAEIATLEEALLDAYNDINYLSGETCDDFFRIVTNVTIDVQETLNSNNIMLDSASGVQSVSLVVVYSGQCRGCGGTPLLSDDGSMTMRQRRVMADAAIDELIAPSVVRERHLSDSDLLECYCPVGVNFSLPTTEVFVESVNATLETVESVEATGIFETTTVSCSSDENDFQAEVTVGLTVTGDLDESELAAIEMSFADTYNSLILRYCDPFFRVVVNVTIVDVEITSISSSTMRMLQLDNVNVTNTTNTTAGNSTMGNSTMGNSTEAPGTDFFFAVFQIVVKGVCRGCGSETSLFNDVSRRRNLGEGFGFSSDAFKAIRMLQTNDTCTCILNFVDNRAPSTSEFLEVFAVTVQEASPSIVVEEAIIVYEGEASTSPSEGPSATPGSVPSDSPSEGPSLSPSSAPSGSPTPIPSGLPTASFPPSSLPTPSPSSSPSASPSASPSMTPTNPPTVLASKIPSVSPSVPPTGGPSIPPSQNPSWAPSSGPTAWPSYSPSVIPTTSPSDSPSDMPSSQPTFFTYDVCRGREVLTIGSDVRFTLTSEHTYDPEVNAICGPSEEVAIDTTYVGVWFSIVINTNQDYDVRLSGDKADYAAALFFGDDGCPSDIGCAGSIYIEGSGSQFIRGRAGVIIYVVVVGQPGDTFRLRITPVAATPYTPYMPAFFVPVSGMRYLEQYKPVPYPYPPKEDPDRTGPGNL